MIASEKNIARDEDMRTVGSQLAKRLLLADPGAIVITLQGELGAGKTTLVRGLLNALGITGAVRSPTYTLIETYEFPQRRIYHLDLYRLGSAADLEGLGLRDLLEEDSILLIEWPEKGGDQLPPADLKLELHYASPGRRLVFRPLTRTGEFLVQSLESMDKSPLSP